MTKYINIYGGPGIGKSTVAATLFSQMKMSGVSVELVTEVAKEFVWEGRYDTLLFQPYVMMKQWRNLLRVKDKVDYVITDSPILLGILYGRKLAPDLPKSYFDFLVDSHNELISPSINFLLPRSFAYDAVGRYQDEEEAKLIDNQIEAILVDAGVEYHTTTPIEWFKSL